jgi:hypothetical protein
VYGPGRGKEADGGAGLLCGGKLVGDSRAICPSEFSGLEGG